VWQLAALAEAVNGFAIDALKEAEELLERANQKGT
jgi:hypothetical protein